MKKFLALLLLLTLISLPAFAADTKVTALTENSAPAATDLLYLVDDPAGSPLSQKMTVANLALNMPDIIVLGADLSVAAAGVKLTGANGALTLLGLGDGTDEAVTLDLNAANVATITSSTGVDNIVGVASYSLGAAGVKLTGDADGAVTLLGLGNGSDEDLTINLDDTSNEITLSSSTGADTINGLDNYALGAAGVKLSGSNGTLSILGLGDGTDELVSLTLNSSNVATLSSSTGVVNLSTGAIALTNTSSVTTPAAVLTPTAIASLGAATAGKMVMTSDSGAADDCTTAGGTGINMCIGDGSAFVFLKSVKASA